MLLPTLSRMQRVFVALAISQGFGISLSELLKGVDKGMTRKHQ